MDMNSFMSNAQLVTNCTIGIFCSQKGTGKECNTSSHYWYMTKKVIIQTSYISSIQYSLKRTSVVKNAYKGCNDNYRQYTPRKFTFPKMIEICSQQFMHGKHFPPGRYSNSSGFRSSPAWTALRSFTLPAQRSTGSH